MNGISSETSATSGLVVSRRTVMKGAGLAATGIVFSSVAIARAERADAAVQATFYVSPRGNDRNQGTVRSPFATLEAARDAVRRLKASSGLPAGGVTVYLRGGRYERTSSFVLESQDSGTEDAPVVYRSYREERAEIVGSKVLPKAAFAPVGDPVIRTRLSPAVVDRVRRISLPGQGITDYGAALASLRSTVYPGEAAVAPAQLICGDQWGTLARWPDAEYTKMGAIVDPGTSGGPLSFTFTDDHPSRWTSIQGAWLFAYPKYIWAYESHEISSVDAATSTITTKSGTTYGAVAGARYFYFNVLEELDAPGEWYLDRSSGVLYVIPPDAMGLKAMRLTQLQAPLVTMTNTDHVTFSDLTFGEVRGAGIVSIGGSHNLVRSCTLGFLGGRGILFAGGSRNGVIDSVIHDVGTGGILIDSGDRPTLTPGGGFVEGNRIRAFSGWQPNYSAGVEIHGVGNRVAYNEIYDAPHVGIFFYGNDHVFEYNELHHLVLDTQDAGAVYTERDWSFQGNVLRYNYLHDINNSESGLQRADGTQAGFYLDSAVGGTYFYGNVFERVTTGILLGSGRSNVIDNNLFIDCPQPLWLVDNSASLVSVLIERLQQMPYRQEPWASRYPALVTLLDDEPIEMKYNAVIRQAFVASGVPTYSAGAATHGSFQYNATLDADAAALLHVDGDRPYVVASSAIVEKIPDFEVVRSSLAGVFVTDEQLTRLRDLITAFGGTGDLGRSTVRALTRLVDRARRADSGGHGRVAAGALEDLLQTVPASGGRGVSREAAGALRPIADALIARWAGDSFVRTSAHSSKSVLAVGDDARIWAMGEMRSGKYVNIFPAHTVRSSSPLVLEVGSHDTVTGRLVGDAVVSVAATSNGVTQTGTVPVRVLPALLSQIAITADTALLTVGGATTALSIAGTLTSGQPATVPISEVQFATSDAKVATVDDAGVVTPVGQGVATITAAATRDGIRAESAFGVIVQPADSHLPDGWQVEQFGHTVHAGAVATEGAAAFANGAFWLAGNGANMWFDSDDATFVHREVEGADLTITATIASGTDVAAGFGLMVRDGLADAANSITWRAQQGGSLIVQYRNAQNPDSWYLSAPAKQLPIALRLTKVGDVFTAYYLQDGAWLSIGSVSVPMGATVNAGLSIFADAAKVAEAYFADVTLDS